MDITYDQVENKSNQREKIYTSRNSEISESIVAKNQEFRNFYIKMNAYIFSPKIRNNIFGDDSVTNMTPVKKKLIIELNESLNELNDFLNSIISYQKRLTQTTDYSQKNHKKLAMKFAYNSIGITKEIINSVKVLIELLSVYGNNDYQHRQTIVSSIKKEFSFIDDKLNINGTTLADSQGRYQVEVNLVNEFQLLKKKLIDKEHLKTGDIIMSFKSKKYIDNDILAKIISGLIQSQVTHAAMVAKGSFGVKMIDSYEDLVAKKRGERIGVKLRDFKIDDGEVFIILRPQITPNQRSAILSTIRKYVKADTQYSIHKLVGAAATLVLTNTVNMFTPGHVNIKNIMGHRKAELFCSEFVNQVFKESGIYLTPKSQDSSIVYPQDIIASPIVEYIGLVFNNNERTQEIVSKYLNDIKI